MGAVAGSFASPDDLVDVADDSAAAEPETAAPFASQTQSPQIVWGAQGQPTLAQPGLYVTAADALQISCWNSIANLPSVDVFVRFMQLDGTVTIQQFSLQNPNSGRVINQVSYSQTEGFILAVAVGPPAINNSRGSLYVNVALIRGAAGSPQMVTVLIADYVSTAMQPGWPQGRIRSAVEGPGLALQHSGTPPGLGTPASYTQPDTVRWSILAVGVTLTTIAGGGNRTVRLKINLGGGAPLLFGSPAVQGQSEFITYTWGQGLPLLVTADGSQQSPLPQGLTAVQNTDFETDTPGLQAGDSFSALLIQVEEWIDV